MPRRQKQLLDPERLNLSGDKSGTSFCDAFQLRCLRNGPSHFGRTVGSLSRFRDNYDLIRERIERVIPGFDQFNERVHKPGGFHLPNGVKERVFKTASSEAQITINPLRPLTLEKGGCSFRPSGVTTSSTRSVQ